MCHALEKLKEIHKQFIEFDINDDVKESADRVISAIKLIREYGNKECFFVDKNGPTLYSTDANGRPIERIQTQRVEAFPWKEYEGLIIELGLLNNVSDGNKCPLQ